MSDHGNSMSDHGNPYTPSPELVEACDVEDESTCEWSCPPVHAVLAAAVAYRTPDNTPELVPWVEVAALIEAAREFADAVRADSVDRGTGMGGYVFARLFDLRAALAPFTQEG